MSAGIIVVAAGVGTVPKLISTATTASAATITQVGTAATFESHRAAAAVTAVPAGTAAGDVLLTLVDTRQGSRVSCPSGARQILNRTHGFVTRLVGCLTVTGQSVPASVQVGISPKNEVAAVTMAFAGVSQGNPVDVLSGSSSGTSPSVTMTGNDLLVFGLGSSGRAAVATAPPGTRLQATVADSAHAQVAAATRSGRPGTAAAGTWGLAPSLLPIAVTVALVPAPAPATTATATSPGLPASPFTSAPAGAVTVPAGNNGSFDDGEGVMYEISYNANITGNTFAGNGIKGGEGNEGFPTGAIYISESGGDASVPSDFAGQLNIQGNSFQDNWGGVVIYQNANRFSGDGQDPGTLTPPSGTNVSTWISKADSICPSHLSQSSPVNYNSLCQWRSQNVTVQDNTFRFDPSDSVFGGQCTTAHSCGQNGLFSVYSSTSAYPTWSVCNAISSKQNNHFKNNTYTGPWSFVYFNQGDTVAAPAWQAGVSNVESSGFSFPAEDQGSTP